MIFLTAFGSVEGAVAAMRDGAFDYLQKPFRREDLLLAVKRALSHATLEKRVAQLQDRLESLGEAECAQSRSPAMLEQMERCRRAAATDATVMLLGEPPELDVALASAFVEPWPDCDLANAPT